MTESLFIADPFSAAQPAGDKVRTFLDILADYNAKRLLRPAHQRDGDAWDKRKKQEYVSRLRKSARGCHPPGSFATYQVVHNGDRPSPVYLNDGYQRLTTLAGLQQSPQSYDMDPEGMDMLLRQDITVQHRLYESHEAAMDDFQLINYGTRLTPYDLCHGYMEYMPSYEACWKSLLDQVEHAVRESESRLRVRARPTQYEREHEHKRKRHTLALFYRFLTEDKRSSHYQDVAAREILKFPKADLIEMRLRSCLLDKGPEEVGRSVKIFRSLMENETAELESRLRGRLGDGAGLAPVTHRWLLDLAVWRRFTNASRQSYGEFVDKLLERTRGQAQWIQPSEDGARRTVTLNLSHLGVLPQLAEWAGMPDFCTRQRRRKGSPLRPGYDHSHLLPYVTHGDGPTFPEPAPTNRARGAQPVGV